MQEISNLPGRIRFRNNSIHYNKQLARYINIYADNLYGVKYSTVNHHTSSILIVYDNLKTNYSLIKKNLEAAIASALENKPESIREYDEYYKLLEKREKAKRNILVYGLIYLGLKVKHSLYGKFFISTSIPALQAASLVTIIGGYPLLKSLYKKFSKNVPTDSDLLLRLTALSFTLARESSKGVLVLMLKALNDYIKYSTDAECQRLLNQSINKTTDTAWLVSSNGQEMLVGIDTLKIGDLVAVHEGEIIPVHGEVMEGSAIINTLQHTGQPLVSRIGKGVNVIEGISILSGQLIIRVVKLPERKEKPCLKKEDMHIHQRISIYQKTITPLALCAGAASYLLSGDLMNALSVVMVLTPSGSGTALSSGLKSYVTLLSKHKIFLKRIETFEKIVNIKHIMFDKTGTLTEEKMKLKNVISFDNRFSEEELLKICAACESDHYHPIATTLQNELKEATDLKMVSRSILIPSRGVEAAYDEHSVLIGNRLFMDEKDVDIKQGLELYEHYEKALMTPVLVSIDGNLSGMLVLADYLKKDSLEMIEKIKHKPNMDISMLTGDNEYRARDVAQKLGIDNVYSNCSNDDKTKTILEHKAKETVMMVGDGINDTNAMIAADISVCFANSSCDQVKLNSDCVIFDDSMTKLTDFLSLSKKAYGRINQIITFSQLYNIFFGGLAFMGSIDPFTAKSINTINSLLVLTLDKHIEYLGVEKQPYLLGKRQ